MDYTPSLGTQRPRPPQRAVSGGSYGGHPLPKRPPLPSRLSNVRSAFQPVNIVDLTSEGMQAVEGGKMMASGSREEVVHSPEVIDLDNQDVEPPAKRVKTMGEEFRASGEDDESKNVDTAHQVLPGAALPNIPRLRPAASKMGAYRRHRFGIEPSARKAHGLDPPAVATRVPPPKKVLDFSPWTGNHQEDVLNENIIKSGYFDKVAGTNQSETNSAKSSIWPSLSQKNHAGLSALSYMYVAVMEKRQTLGKCTAPSTFKPPPRLAVQEAKRAKWLEDLADPAVSLRRLSKTIPHGIKGKLLMEQCMSKYIPLHRAMWLVRGVGMHELRAFRRKGFNEAQAASGEIKWVREWTVNVTQFLEDVIAACGQPNWQRNMNYAVKLAAALYSEKLLDVDYYLDWIVSSLEESMTERLPIWIIITQIHWKALTMFGRRGRRLAKGISEHLRSVTGAGVSAGAGLRASLQKMAAVLSVANRGCLILPRTWQKYSGLLTPSPESPEGSPVSNIARRNERLAAPLNKTPQNTRSAYLDLYDVLDSAGLDSDLDALARKCVTLLPDSAKLIPALLNWASTWYRTGESRTYLAARIIASVRNAGHDTDSVILRYLASVDGLEDGAEARLHRAVVELTRLQAFSVGRYFQWLIASGALYAEKRSSAISLIAALPTTGLPVQVLNTRKMLMGRLGYSVGETQEGQSIQKEVDELFASGDQETLRIIQLPQRLNTSAAYNLAGQVAEKADLMAKELGLSSQHFCMARDFIERVGDLSSLAKLAMAASHSENPALLAAVADTVNGNAAAFAALEQLTPLTDRLSEQYLAQRPHQALNRTLIRSLVDLFKRVPGKASLVKLLIDDLALCEQQTTSTACSPASDNLIDMHASKLDSDEDLDAVFASGNVMDEQLMQRVFSRIVQRASKPTGSGSLTRVCGWLEQLRGANASGILQSIVDNYLRTCMSGGVGSAISVSAIAGLTLSGCSSLNSIVDAAKNNKDPEVAQRLVSIFVSPSEDLGLDLAEAYRSRLQQKRCQTERAIDLINILRTSLACKTFDAQDDDVVHFVIKTAAVRKDAINELFANSAATEVTRKNASRLLNAILDKAPADTVDMSSVIARATPLNIDFCVAVKHLHGSSAGENASSRDAILRAFEERSEVWPQLLSVADETTIRALREKAQDALLRSAAEFKPPGDGRQEDEIRRTLDLLALVSDAGSQHPDVAFTGVVVERLRDVEKQLSNGSVEPKEARPTREQVLRTLNLLLRLATFSAYGSEDDVEVVQQARANLLHALCTLLVHRELQLHRQAIEHIFDLASTLSDSLPDATLASLKTKLPTDARLNFILGGSLNTTTTWLSLATQVPPAGTQQQRALSKHQAQQQQQMQPQKSTPRSIGSQGVPSTSAPTAQRGWPAGAGSKMPAEVKMTPFQLRQWEIISDPASSVGENDTALSLGLFGMRKV